MKINQNPKVFGIGFHKTGTTSLAMALSILGYKNNRGLDTLRHKWGLDYCVKLLDEKNYYPYLEYIKNFDSTLDNPWYLLYRELDLNFPDSKFILTVRDDSKWLESCKFFFKGKKNPIHKHIYGKVEIKGNEEVYLDTYQKHNLAVRKYFANRKEDFIELNWEKGDDWKMLCNFLKKPVLNIPFPHINKKSEI